MVQLTYKASGRLPPHRRYRIVEGGRDIEIREVVVYVFGYVLARLAAASLASMERAV